MEYTPEYAPEITVRYTITFPGQQQTRNQPGYPIEIQIDEVLIHGKEISGFIDEIVESLERSRHDL